MIVAERSRLYSPIVGFLYHQGLAIVNHPDPIECIQNSSDLSEDDGHLF